MLEKDVFTQEIEQFTTKVWKFLRLSTEVQKMRAFWGDRYLQANTTRGSHRSRPIEYEELLQLTPNFPLLFPHYIFFCSHWGDVGGNSITGAEGLGIGVFWSLKIQVERGIYVHSIWIIHSWKGGWACPIARDARTACRRHALSLKEFESGFMIRTVSIFEIASEKARDVGMPFLHPSQ